MIETRGYRESLSLLRQILPGELALRPTLATVIVGDGQESGPVGDPEPKRLGHALFCGRDALGAGVDEEALERALIELRELERKGELQYDRNTPSWKEFKRRQKERREAKKKRAAMRDAETKTSSRPRKPRKQQLAAGLRVCPRRACSEAALW